MEHPGTKLGRWKHTVSQLWWNAWRSVTPHTHKHRTQTGEVCYYRHKHTESRLKPIPPMEREDLDENRNLNWMSVSEDFFFLRLKRHCHSLPELHAQVGSTPFSKQQVALHSFLALSALCCIFFFSSWLFPLVFLLWSVVCPLERSFSCGTACPAMLCNAVLICISIASSHQGITVLNHYNNGWLDVWS